MVLNLQHCPLLKLRFLGGVFPCLESDDEYAAREALRVLEGLQVRRRTATPINKTHETNENGSALEEEEDGIADWQMATLHVLDGVVPSLQFTPCTTGGDPVGQISLDQIDKVLLVGHEDKPDPVLQIVGKNNTNAETPTTVSHCVLTTYTRHTTTTAQLAAHLQALLEWDSLRRHELWEAHQRQEAADRLRHERQRLLEEEEP